MAIKGKNQKKFAAAFQKKNQKGFALIFVLIFTALLLGIVADIVYQMQINVRSSIDEQNILDAETSAQTGIEFARLLLNLNNLASSYQNNPLLNLPKNIYSTLNGQPIGNVKDLINLEDNSSIPLNKVIAPEIYSALKALPGYFVLNIESENSKFNINMLQSRNYQTAQTALLRLFSTQDAQEFLQYMGYTPQQLVDSLSSYIKIPVTDNYLMAATQGLYDAINAKYQPKHAALESLQELHRIPGFNYDVIYNMYSPYFTIWPIAGTTNTLNINSVPVELIAPLLTQQGQEIQDNIWDKFEDYRENNTFTKSNLATWIQTNITSLSSDTNGQSFIQNILGYNDTIFKVESRGVSNGIERTLVAVFQQVSGSGGQQQGQGSSGTSPPGQPPASTTTPPPSQTTGGQQPGGTGSQSPAQAPAGSGQSGSGTTYQIISSEWRK